MLQEVIIYGGCGQLGRAVLSLFKQSGYKTISIDRVANNDADQNIIGIWFRLTISQIIS